MPLDKPEDLDGFRLRIDDPGLGNSKALVEGELHPAVARCRRRGQDLYGHVRNALDILLANDRQMLLRDKDQIRNDDQDRIFGENHVAGSGEKLSEGIEIQETADDPEEISGNFLMSGRGEGGMTSSPSMIS